MMKKILSIILIVIMVSTCLVACGDKPTNEETKPNENNSTTTTPENETPEVDQNVVEFFVDGEFESKICIKFPEEVRDNYHTELSSSFTDGWCQITFCLNKDFSEPTYYLFTLYCSKDNSYEKFKDRKGYEVIGTDGTYTLIWYEHNTKEGVALSKVLEQIELFESKYKDIKASLSIEK